MDIFFVERLSRMRLQQCYVERAGDVSLFRVGPGEAIALQAGEWNDIGSYFRHRTQRTGNALIWAIWLQVPIALAVLMFIARNPVLHRLEFQLDAIVPGLPLLLMTITWPLLAAARHGARVLRTVDRITTELSSRPRIPLPESSGSKLLRVVEIAVLLVFGPGVFIDLYGSVYPDAFRNTPWVGRQMTVESTLGLAVIATVIVYEIGQRRRGKAARNNF